MVPVLNSPVAPIPLRYLEPWMASLELAVVVGRDGRILEVNRAFARKFGRAGPGWTGEAWDELVHPEDATDWLAMAERVTRPPFHISREARWQTAQGWRWIAWEETALRSVEGEIEAVRAVGRDVTKHRLAEEHYRKLAQAVEQAPVSIVITTPGGVPQYVNSRYTETTGCTLEEIFEREIPVLREGHLTAASYRQFCAAVAGGRKWAGEVRTQRKDGRELWELVQVSPIRNALDEISYLLCLREDITERKTLEDQLLQAQKMESLGTLAGGIAHDFNNIIAIVRGFTELSLPLAAGDPQLRRYLAAVHDAALRAAGLVSRIMSFSRKSDVAFRPMQLDRVVEEVTEMLRETFPRTIELTVELEPGMETFQADPNQVRQVLMNLCVNARDAMDGAGRLTVRTRRVAGTTLSLPGVEPEQTYVCISVSDTGHGLKPGVRARIFEPFFTTKGDRGGTGLGLAVVYGVVTSHRGLLDVESIEDEGTTFHVYLPLKTIETDGPVRLGELLQGAIPEGREQVLLVEDEAGIQDILRTALEGAGYRLRVASDGAEAIEYLLGTETRFDLVLLDVNLPRLGGVDVLKILRQHQARVPVLVISGNLTPSVMAELDKLEPDLVMAKPFQVLELGRAMRHLLDEAARRERQAGRVE